MWLLLPLLLLGLTKSLVRCADINEVMRRIDCSDM
jgi:hypothetical protein